MLEVIERLAHPHEHDVADVVFQVMTGGVPLGHDLVHFKRSNQAHLGGLAETASHRATDLRRDAQRAPIATRGAATGNDDRLGLEC